MKTRVIALLMLASASSLGLPADFARAEALSRWQDPFGSQQKIAPYGSNLKPVTCPAPPDTTKPLALNQVVIATLCHNPESRAAYLSLIGSAYNYDGTIMSFLPDVTAGVNGGASASRYDGESAQTHSSSASAQAGMILYDFGRRETTLDIAERSLAAAGLSYDSTLQGFIATSLQQYFLVLTTQNNLEVQKFANTLSKSILEASELRYQNGLVPMSDVLQARTSYAQSELALQRAENDLANSQSRLAQLMGFAPLTPLIVQDIDDSNLRVAPFSSPIAALIEEAKDKRVDLQRNRLQLDNAKDSLENTQRRALPSISANARTGFDNFNIIDSDTARSDTIGVSVSIPIFTGFQQIFAEREQRTALEGQKLQLIQAERNVEQDVLTSWQNYNTSNKSFTISFLSLETANKLKDFALSRYREGLGSILDVLTAEISYRNAMESHLQTRYSLLTSRVNLVRAVGILSLKNIEPAADSLDQPQAASDAPAIPELVETAPIFIKETNHETH